MMGFGFGGIFGSLLWGLFMLFTMLLPVIVIVGIVYLVYTRWERRKNGEEDGGLQTPLAILKRRYASGEISKEEFGKMRENLLRS